MAGDPARDAHADCPNLIGADPRAGEPLDAAALQPEISRGSNHDLFEIAHVLVHVAPVGPQVDDRVADDLSGPVIGDVAAAARLVHLDPPRREQIRRRQSDATWLPRA